MAETKFIKISATGGYDKADVDKRLDFLYNLVNDLKNELRIKTPAEKLSGRLGL